MASNSLMAENAFEAGRRDARAEMIDALGREGNGGDEETHPVLPPLDLTLVHRDDDRDDLQRSIDTLLARRAPTSSSSLTDPVIPSVASRSTSGAASASTASRLPAVPFRTLDDARDEWLSDLRALGIPTPHDHLPSSIGDSDLAIRDASTVPDREALDRDVLRSRTSFYPGVTITNSHLRNRETPMRSVLNDNYPSSSSESSEVEDYAERRHRMDRLRRESHRLGRPISASTAGTLASEAYANAREHGWQTAARRSFLDDQYRDLEDMAHGFAARRNASRSRARYPSRMDVNTSDHMDLDDNPTPFQIGFEQGLARIAQERQRGGERPVPSISRPDPDAFFRAFEQGIANGNTESSARERESAGERPVPSNSRTDPAEFFRAYMELARGGNELLVQEQERGGERTNGAAPSIPLPDLGGVLLPDHETLSSVPGSSSSSLPYEALRPISFLSPDSEDEEVSTPEAEDEARLSLDRIFRRAVLRTQVAREAPDPPLPSAVAATSTSPASPLPPSIPPVAPSTRFDPETYAPGPFRNTIRRIRVPTQPTASSTIPARTSRTVSDLAHGLRNTAPSIPPLSFDSSDSPFLSRGGSGASREESRPVSLSYFA